MVGRKTGPTEVGRKTGPTDETATNAAEPISEPRILPEGDPDLVTNRPYEPGETSSDPDFIPETPAASGPPDLSGPAEASEPRTAAPARETADDLHDEEAGPSLAARLLTILALLILGAALGIWAAPRLAPRLPSGLAPVAQWLSPVQPETQARLTGVEQRLEAELASMSAQIQSLAPGEMVDSSVSNAVSAAETRLQGEIAALRDQLGAVDNSETQQRLERLTAQVEGQVAEVATLKEQIAAVPTDGGAASAETAAQIDVYRAELEGLRAEMGQLSDTVTGFAARLDDIEANAGRAVAEAEARVEEVEAEAGNAVDQAGLQSDLALVRTSLEGGQPFADPLVRITDNSGAAIPSDLDTAAQSGIASLAQLRDSFPEAAHAAIRDSIVAGADGGVLGRSRAFLEAQIASRSLTPQDGTDTDAVLSRMEESLRQDDLAAALTEAEALPPEAAVAMSEWLAAARLRQGALDGFASLTADLSATN